MCQESEGTKNSLFDKGTIGEMGCVSRKKVTIYGGLGLSGCTGDCEGCEGGREQAILFNLNFYLLCLHPLRFGKGNPEDPMLV